MLVYGDPKFSRTLSSLLAQLAAQLASIDLVNLDDLRSFLVASGQLEQAVADGSDPPLAATIQNITDAAAALFCNRWMGSAEPMDTKCLREALKDLSRVLNNSAAANTIVTVKVPEGFAFYALFPEQYCASALQWAKDHPDCNRVLVAGIRSIGTTLSAVVKETLLAIGWEATRVTLRPTGHPFHREVKLDLTPPATDCVLVVDEGPGISGSSMAAVAQAFSSAGVKDISFLPGHSGEPGASASTTVRVVWQQTPRYLTELKDLKWNNLSLQQSMAVETEKWDSMGSVEIVEDISAGGWRKFAFSNEDGWPAVAAQFERMKFLCRNRRDSAVIWKFAGIHCDENGGNASERMLARLSFHAAAGFGREPLGSCRGFVAMPWIEGVRLSRAENADTSILRHLGRYIVHAASAALPPEEYTDSVDRLAEMLFWNTKEALGDAAAEQTRALAEAAHACDIRLSYGDGHLAPHEWIRASDGAVWKVDAEGHTGDHTLVGRQSVLWDVAGALTEWDLTAAAAKPMFSVIEESGVRLDLDALAFFQQAYTAFRLGLLSIATQQSSDAREQRRLRSAQKYYRRHLAQLLKTEPLPVGG